jgi:hypothetical protein
LAVGWGITDAETTPVEVADTLQEVEVPILNNCTKRYSNASMYICGGFAEGGKDSCQGMYIVYFTDYGHMMTKSLILCGPNSNLNPK